MNRKNTIHAFISAAVVAAAFLFTGAAHAATFSQLHADYIKSNTNFNLIFATSTLTGFPTSTIGLESVTAGYVAVGSDCTGINSYSAIDTFCSNVQYLTKVSSTTVDGNEVPIYGGVSGLTGTVVIQVRDYYGGANLIGTSDYHTGGWSGTNPSLSCYGSPCTDPGTMAYLDFSGGTAANVLLYFPTASSTLLDFNNWYVDGHGVDNGAYVVFYGTSSTNLRYADTALFTEQGIVPVGKVRPLSPGVWYANAFLDYNDASGTPQFVSSGITSFTITDATSTTQVVTPECPTWWYDPAGYTTCQAFSYLFVPTTQQQSDLGDRFNFAASGIKTKPPFGYFTSAWDALNGASDTATSTLLDASTTAQFGSIFFPIDAFLAALIWVGFAFAMVRNIKTHI
jgi:hypothetical protein